MLEQQMRHEAEASHASSSDAALVEEVAKGKSPKWTKKVAKMLPRSVANAMQAVGMDSNSPAAQIELELHEMDRLVIKAARNVHAAEAGAHHLQEQTALLQAHSASAPTKKLLTSFGSVAGSLMSTGVVEGKFDSARLALRSAARRAVRAYDAIRHLASNERTKMKAQQELVENLKAKKGAKKAKKQKKKAKKQKKKAKAAKKKAKKAVKKAKKKAKAAKKAAAKKVAVVKAKAAKTVAAVKAK